MRDELQIRTAAGLGLKVRTAADLPDLMGAVWGVDGLILAEADLSREFFQLRSGLAGETLQKLTNSGIRTALVLPDFAAHGERFAELAHEHAGHPLIRFVQTEAEARAWLGASAVP